MGTSVASSTLGTLACWQTSSTARMPLVLGLAVAAHDDVQVRIIRAQADELAEQVVHADFRALLSHSLPSAWTVM